jgi:hypothetical protein
MSLYLGAFGRKILKEIVARPKLREVGRIGRVLQKVSFGCYTPGLTRETFVLFQNAKNGERVFIGEDGLYQNKLKIAGSRVVSARFTKHLKQDNFIFNNYSPELLVQQVRSPLVSTIGEVLGLFTLEQGALSAFDNLPGHQISISDLSLGHLYWGIIAGPVIEEFISRFLPALFIGFSIHFIARPIYKDLSAITLDITGNKTLNVMTGNAKAQIKTALFTGIEQGMIKSHLKLYWAGGLLSSLVFGLLHPYGVGNIEPTIFGLYSWYLFHKRGFGYSCFAHSLKNSLCAIYSLLYLVQSGCL